MLAAVLVLTWLAPSIDWRLVPADAVADAWAVAADRVLSALSEITDWSQPFLQGLIDLSRAEAARL
jgi:hypothetical protein